MKPVTAIRPKAAIATRRAGTISVVTTVVVA